HFVYCIAEFLVMLLHDTLHSKQVIKAQGLIKHYDSLLASGHEPKTHVIVNSVRIEDDKWKRLSRQIVDLLLAHLQSQDQSLLDIYSTQLILFDVVSSLALRSIDPFVVAFRALVIEMFVVFITLLRILTNTRQLRDQIDMTLVSLASDYLYVLIDTCTYGHNLFDLIHRTSVASHLFVCEGIHLDESGLVLVLLIEQFLPLPLNKQL
ncbi:unnamed protein product, partial [Rotaria sp. Silwood1]